MEHVGVVVEDLAAAIEFFVELGLELVAEWPAEGEWVDRIIGLDGARAENAMLQAPDGGCQIELIKFLSPPSPASDRAAPSNAPGLRHLTFAVDDIDATVAALRARGGELIGEVVRYQDSWRLCYARGPEGFILELAEKLG